MAGWRERIQAIRDRLLGREPPRAEAAPQALPLNTATGHIPVEAKKNSVSADKRVPSNRIPLQTSQQITAINLGIDFGTSFTKVCFRDVGREESGIVAIGKRSEQAIIPSVVTIGSSGRLYLGDDAAGETSPVSIAYLKMRLAGVVIGHALPFLHGRDLNEQESIRALSAWFLASVIARSQEWMARHESDRLQNRRVVWTANVGVPVEHYDSDALEQFREVLGIAWLWVKDRRIPATLQSAASSYVETVSRLEKEVSDFHAIPEIAAAVQSFVMSREAVPGIYVYFDIGGGTVDGVAFNYLNDDGERRINFYSGRVRPLGIAAIGAGLDEHAPEDIDAFKLEELLQRCPPTERARIEKEVRKLVADVVMTAKSKDSRDWQQDAIQGGEVERKFIGRLTPDRMKPLDIFIGGGGSTSNWYKATIKSTYTEFQHYNAGIPPYQLVEVPKPGDLTMGDHIDDAFTRFAISYGLSIPFGEGPEVRLPSQFSKAEKPRRRQLPGVIDYSDSKDVC